MARPWGISRNAKGMHRPENRDTDRVSFGEGVLIDGVDSEAVRRAHMRDLTTARQAAEQRRTRERKAPPEATTAERRCAQQARTTAADAALQPIRKAGGHGAACDR